MFDCLSSIKVPSGYSSNIKDILNLAEKKFTNLKSHDCHVLMTELLPVVLRGILPDNVRLTIVKLCAFLNAVSQKLIDPDNLIKLCNEHGTIYAISSDFGDRMTTQSMRLMVLLKEHF